VQGAGDMNISMSRENKYGYDNPASRLAGRDKYEYGDTTTSGAAASAAAAAAATTPPVVAVDKYDYRDPNSGPGDEQRCRERPRCCGSVTKYSLDATQEVKDQQSQEQEAQQQQQQQQVQYQQPQPQQQDNEEQMSYNEHVIPLQDHSASNNTATSLHNQRNSFGNMSISKHDVSVDGMSYDGSVDNMSEDGLIFDPSPATTSAAPPTMEKEKKKKKKVDWDDSVLAGIIHPNPGCPLVRPRVNK
jgi:hypothetical protein